MSARPRFVSGNHWSGGSRFAPKPAAEPVPETPAPETVVQEPMASDDRVLSSTTRRFRVWIGDVQLREAFEPHVFAKAWLDFGIVEPTVLDLRNALSSRFGPGQVRVVQLKRPETDDLDARNDVDHDPYGHLEPDDILERVMNPGAMVEEGYDPWDVAPER